MKNFDFLVTITAGTATYTNTINYSYSNHLEAAILAGEVVRQRYVAQGIKTNHIRVELDPHAAVRQEGRKMGLTEEQIERFISRQA